jgi:signal transduction histidine kinase
MLYSVNEAGFALPADHNLFLAQALAGIARRRAALDNGRYFKLPDFERLIVAEELSIRISENFPEADTLEKVKENKLQHLPLAGETLYGIYHKTNGTSVLVLLSTENIASIFANVGTDFKDSDVAYRIVDESGRFVTGADEVVDEPFVAVALGKDFPGWKIELSFKAGDVFERAASRHVAVYVWTGVLVIVLILLAGGFAAQAVRKQIKLNKLKNDFIATVSHELKTPLASIRLLVDTLLEGNYKDQQQVTDYFQLVSKENERLTRLVDNFLTFSRMERNKQTFAMAWTSPVRIARAAAEVIKTKFNVGRCDFQSQIADNLPDVFADHDVMVTAIVNLLDNAYKYSYDDKKIELKVFSEDNFVCFSVKDNGIGMNRRQVRKIFDRFYQADTSLSRRVEGTGLGLSIVKFIVDAHKGTISVDSVPGQGTTFTIRLTAKQLNPIDKRVTQ